MAKKLTLSKEEQTLEESFNKDHWVSVSETKKIKTMGAARTTLKKLMKDMRTNIRISQLDNDLVRGRAKQEGVPYQTLMSSIVHKYVTNQLVERSVVEELKDAIMRVKKAG